MQLLIRSSLSAFGWPILQSGVSTIIGLTPLLIPASYILRTFSKLLMAIIALGVIHALVVLPACLAVVGRCVEAVAGGGDGDDDGSGEVADGADGDGGCGSDGVVGGNGTVGTYR